MKAMSYLEKHEILIGRNMKANEQRSCFMLTLKNGSVNIWKKMILLTLGRFNLIRSYCEMGIDVIQRTYFLLLEV